MSEISEDEMGRRLAIAIAQTAITTAMKGHDLTALEWLKVFNDAAQFVIGWGLKEQWQQESTDSD